MSAWALGHCSVFYFDILQSKKVSHSKIIELIVSCSLVSDYSDKLNLGEGLKSGMEDFNCLSLRP